MPKALLAAWSVALLAAEVDPASRPERALAARSEADRAVRMSLGPTLVPGASPGGTRPPWR
jgi:hypothetical protein